MKTFELSGITRDVLGKKETKKVRKEGDVPCVLYGGEKPIHFTVKSSDVRKLIYTPNVYIVKLIIGETAYNAIIQDLQFHPVTDNLLHIDLLEVFEDKPVTIKIPVVLEGLALGVKEGGKLQLSTRRLKAKAVFSDFPDSFTVDVSNVKLGGTVKVGELNFDKIELKDPKDLVIAAVKLTRAAKGALGSAAANAGTDAAK